MSEPANKPKPDGPGADSAVSAADHGASTHAAPEAGTTHDNPLLKLLVEIGPLVVFFVVNSQSARFISDPGKAIFWGTGAFMAATIVSLAVSRSLFGRIPVMPLVSGVLIMVFGTLTIILQDELFIKLKPTIVNLLFAAGLFLGLSMGKSFLKVLFGDVFHLTEEGWRKLTFRWASFFVALALINEIVWRNFSTDFWVSFKVFGIMPLTIVFAIAQLGLIKRYEPRQGDGGA